MNSLKNNKNNRFDNNNILMNIVQIFIFVVFIFIFIKVMFFQPQSLPVDIDKLINREKRIKTPIVFFLLLLVSLSVTYLMAYKSIVIGLIFLVLVIALPLLIKSIQSLTFGYYLLIIYSFFLFFIGRLMPVHIPLGVGVEFLLIILLVGILVSNRKINWDLFGNPITYVFLISTVYGLLQFFNPNAISLNPWILSTRGLFFNLILFLFL